MDEAKRTKVQETLDNLINEEKDYVFYMHVPSNFTLKRYKDVETGEIYITLPMDFIHDVNDYINEETIPIWYPSTHLYECEACGDIVSSIDNYCPHCGRKINWEKERDYEND